ncbi:MAG TPA: thioredoxin [Gammaproteobacteria bacterium]|nr:thioredoxin [Gammaproteobacteria bacterium]
MSEIFSINKLTFEDEVLKSKTPVLVDFWAEWCAPCKAMLPLVEEIAKEMTPHIKVVKVDVGDQENGYPLATEYGIRGVPTFLLFIDGNPVASHIGAMDKKQLIEFISTSTNSSPKE